MRDNILQICRQVLENAYRTKLGIEFGNTINDIKKGSQPVWLDVSDDDLTSKPSSTESKAGLLLDPEIGILTYILPFHEKNDLRSQIKRALALRSQLSIERNYNDKIADSDDERGAWRIILHWLVNESMKSKWIDQIMAVRRDTGYSEELTFEALFLTSNEPKADIERYGFPRLLLTTREVFKKAHIKEITQWLSANELVENALAGFVSQFHVPEQCKFAQDIIETMQRGRTSSNTVGDANQPPTKPKTIRRIHIRNFRNLRDSRFDFGSQPVSASIVHGPNGTGKSSLCEAISVALFQSSFRYKKFVDRGREPDIIARDRTTDYLEQYLAPVEDAQGGPEIALDEQSLTRPRLINTDSTGEVDIAMCGTILTQDMSLEFAQMPADELGARVLRGYSDLADHIEEYTESRANQANAERKEFLRDLGLSAAITKIETAYERIAQHEINQSLPPLSPSLVVWLDKAGTILGTSAGDFPSRWQTWGDDEKRKELSRRIARSSKSPENIMGDLRKWLDTYNELASRSAELIKKAKSRIASIQHELEGATARITAWGEWLEKHAEAPQMCASPESDALSKSRHELQMKQKQVLERGHSVKAHLDHLMQVEAYVRETWSKEHVDDCPTCGASHAEHGGILKVVESLRAKTAVERDRLRGEYAATKTQIEAATKKLPELGQARCPLSSEEQASIVEALQWLIPETARFAEWISVKAQRDMLLAAVAEMQQMPPVPQTRDAQREADGVTQKILSRFQQADNVFQAPMNWKPVKEKLNTTLAEIVKNHLPDTLARLWVELALNLTSASWLLPERPCIDVTTRRGNKRSTVRVKGRLARYILNQAEAHILGLAWFFTQYLTRGRFFHACMVMDDPAHELDQTSFRDLCRLWETIMRLHRVYDRPLKLIVTLNQESRATEAARATAGILSVLNWAADQEEHISAISVIGEGFRSPQPSILFEKTGT